MSVYVLLMAWLVLCGAIYHTKRCKKLSMLYVFGALMLVMGLRGLDVGVDTKNYHEAFLYIERLPWNLIFERNASLEPGFVLFSKIIASFGGNYFAFQMISATLFCGCMGFVIEKLSKNPYCSALIFAPVIYLLAFNISRQMLSVAFAFVGYAFFVEKKYSVCALWLLLSVSFHVSSLVFLLLLFAYKFRNYRLFAPIAILGILLLVSQYMLVFSFIADNINEYASYYGNNRTIQTAGNVKILWAVECGCSLWILLSKKRDYTDDSNIVALASLLFVACNIIGLKINYFERVGLVFSPFISLLFPIIAEKFNGGGRCFYYVIVDAFFLMYFYLSTESGQYVYSFLPL